MPKLPKIDELFSDPKHSEMADWFRGIFKTVMAEVASEEEKRREKNKSSSKSFMDFLFDKDEDEDDKD